MNSTTMEGFILATFVIGEINRRMIDRLAQYVAFKNVPSRAREFMSEELYYSDEATRYFEQYESEVYAEEVRVRNLLEAMKNEDGSSVIQISYTADYRVSYGSVYDTPRYNFDVNFAIGVPDKGVVLCRFTVINQVMQKTMDNFIRETGIPFVRVSDTLTHLGEELVGATGLPRELCDIVKGFTLDF
jgi:hypothetical protein